ncbi:MAG: MupG family TIM beta-alpha barrel fold protein [Cellulosilyticaceae bacterium]
MKQSTLGFSAYLSHFEEQKPFLMQFAHEGRLVFISLHIPEEIGETFAAKAQEMIGWLKTYGFKIVGDISKRTLTQFGCHSIVELAEKLELSMLRIDYGFEVDEIIEAGKKYPLAFNASTVAGEDAEKIKVQAKQIVAIHNFYPREYTGLSERQFGVMNQELRAKGVGVMAFIPCMEKSRGPVYAGLPTLEHQRMKNAYVNFMELIQRDDLDGVILGDLGVRQEDADLIRKYEKEKVISIPVCFEPPYEYLYNQTYTIRVDSPDRLLRLQESREFATPGEKIIPYQCKERKRGVITCDNERYGRYSGEIQLLKEALPMDSRVNVIGTIGEAYMELVDFVPNGYKICFVKNK